MVPGRQYHVPSLGCIRSLAVDPGDGRIEPPSTVGGSEVDKIIPPRMRHPSRVRATSAFRSEWNFSCSRGTSVGVPSCPV